MSGPPPKFHGVSDIRAFFRTNETPIYFVSPTAFNLLGIDRWVRNFRYVNYYDSFDGGHPNVFVPADRRAPEFESIEDICNYLLGTRRSRSMMRRDGQGGKVMFVMFDDETEELAAELGLRVAHPPARAAPPARLQDRDDPARQRRRACPACPTCSAARRPTPSCSRWPHRAGLGTDLVVQTPYGDSGQTTFFIQTAADWDERARRSRWPRRSSR